MNVSKVKVTEEHQTNVVCRDPLFIFPSLHIHLKCQLPGLSKEHFAPYEPPQTDLIFIETLNVEFGTAREIELSQMISSGRMTDARLLATNNQPILLRGSNSRGQRLTDEENLTALGLSAYKDRKTYRRSIVHDEVQDFNTKPGYSNLENKLALDLKDSKTTRVDSAINEKLLPKIPTQTESTETSEVQIAPHLNSRHTQQQQRFSFVPGGDLEKVPNRHSKSSTASESLNTSTENYWGFSSRGDSKGSVATVVHDKPSWSGRSPNNTASIAAKRAIASRGNTE